MVVIPDEVLRVRYNSNYNACGFIIGHEYLVKIDKDKYTYKIHAIKDITINEDIDYIMNLASENSIHKNFEFL